MKKAITAMMMVIVGVSLFGCRKAKTQPTATASSLSATTTVASTQLTAPTVTESEVATTKAVLTTSRATTVRSTTKATTATTTTKKSAPLPKGQCMVDLDNVAVVITLSRENASGYEIEFTTINKSSSQAYVEISELCVNQVPVDMYGQMILEADSNRTDRYFVPREFMDLNNVEKVTRVTFHINASVNEVACLDKDFTIYPRGQAEDEPYIRQPREYGVVVFDNDYGYLVTRVAAQNDAGDFLFLMFMENKCDDAITIRLGYTEFDGMPIDGVFHVTLPPHTHLMTEALWRKQALDDLGIVTPTNVYMNFSVYKTENDILIFEEDQSLDLTNWTIFPY